MTKGMHDWHSAAAHLLEAIADSLDGFEYVAAHPDHVACHTTCARHIEDRRALLHAMREAMRAHGLDHDPQGTLLGAAHRLFMKLRSAVSDSDAAVMEEMLRGEEFLATKAWRFSGLWRLPKDLKRQAVALETHIGNSIRELRAALHAEKKRAGRSIATI